MHVVAYAVQDDELSASNPNVQSVAVNYEHVNVASMHLTPSDLHPTLYVLQAAFVVIVEAAASLQVLS